jgi:hypothetical protein
VPQDNSVERINGGRAGHPASVALKTA